MRRPLSEIDGLKSRSRRGQLPWYGVLSPSRCRSCLGRVKEGEAKSTAASMSQRQPRPTTIISFYVSHEWKFLQLGEGWLMAAVNQSWECCMEFYGWGKWCSLCTTHTTLPNPLCLYLPFTIQGFCAFQNKRVIETKLTMCIAYRNSLWNYLPKLLQGPKKVVQVPYELMQIQHY